MGQLIKLNKSDLEQSFEEIIEQEDDLVDFIMIARFRNDEEQQESMGGNFRTLYKWFGEESSINLLGLTHHMYDLISDYIRRNT
jgi:hypothetical protein